MKEKIKDVLDAYTFQTTRVCRGRGAFICDTDQGMKIVKAYHRSPQRLEFEQLVKYTIRDRGYYYVDQLLPNKEGQYLNNNKDGQMYTVRDWFEGRECDVKNAADVLAAVRQLAVLHMLMRRCDLSEERVEQFSFQDTRQIFLKRRKELRAIYGYIRQKKQLNDFEKLYMQLYCDCMKAAEAAIGELNQFDFDGLRKKALKERTLCHGDFNYHQVILNRKYTAVVNFDKMHYDIQVKDLYQFLRKVLEKNNWDSSLGEMIMDTYLSVRTLSEEEKRVLYAMLIFPEKFWKISNRYYNSRKSWISGVNYDKLCHFKKTSGQRQDFLNTFKYAFIF